MPQHPVLLTFWWLIIILWVKRFILSNMRLLPYLFFFFFYPLSKKYFVFCFLIMTISSAISQMHWPPSKFACKCDVHRIFQCRNAMGSICHVHLSPLHIVKLHCGLAALLHSLRNPTSQTSCSSRSNNNEGTMFTRYFVNPSSILHDQSAFATIVHT